MNIIDEIIEQIRDEHGSSLTDAEVRELAELERQDMVRKGCTHDHANCSGCNKMNDCPLSHWTETHPEFKDDELAKKIDALQNRARDNFRADMKAKVSAEFNNLKLSVDLDDVATATEDAARDMIEALEEFKQTAGLSNEIQLQALAKVNEAFNRIRQNELGWFLEKTRWFAK